MGKQNTNKYAKKASSDEGSDDDSVQLNKRPRVASNASN